MTIGSFDSAPPTLPEALARTAAKRLTRGITLLDNRGREASHRDFAELQRAAQAAAGRWLVLGVKPKTPIVVCLPTSWEFLDAWLGAILAGALPVALAPPGALGSPKAQVAKALRICNAIDAGWIVASQSFIDAATEQHQQEPNDNTTRLISVDAFNAVTAQPAPTLHAEPEQTAFLQLTSGSTGLPRAVEISHRALIHNASAIADSVLRLDGKPCKHIVSWLPLYHDMGLIGCLSHCILTGTPMDLLSPRGFLARPWLWLEAISRRDGAFSPGPNFAYQLCVERVASERIKELDLSRAPHLFSGSEMVRPETMDAFFNLTAAAGFEPARVRPAYGLAETTLAVTIEGRGQSVRTRLGIGAEVPTVALGEAARDTEIQIWPTENGSETPLAQDHVGRVMVRTPSLMTGYYKDPEATAAAFDNGWLDTGDLGFLYDSELYLTGRSKELLILNGTNVMPHEIEWLAEAATDGGGSQRCGAFSLLTDTGEVPILVLETIAKDTDQIAAIESEVRTEIGRSLSLPLEDLVMVRRGSIPRTSSGKVQRRTLKQMYLDGELDRVNPA